MCKAEEPIKRKKPCLRIKNYTQFVQAMERKKQLNNFLQLLPSMWLDNCGIKVNRYSTLCLKKWIREEEPDKYVDLISVTIDGDCHNPLHSDEELYTVMSIIGHRAVRALENLVYVFDYLKEGEIKDEDDDD